MLAGLTTGRVSVVAACERAMRCPGDGVIASRQAAPAAPAVACGGERGQAVKLS